MRTGGRSITEEEPAMSDLRVSFPKPCDEDWTAMAPASRARICGRCDKAVHDLSTYGLEEAEALLRGNPGLCVRARIGPDGAVALKPGLRGGARRMMATAAATAGLLMAGAPATAKQDRPGGAIVGKIEASGFPVRVTATAPDGRAYRAKAKGNGRFRIKHVPPGVYTLTFVPDCGDKWTVENVAVGDGQTRLPDAESPNQCIVVGLLRIEDGPA
jgi:Carboxypeptidase regulatory-like domain